MHEISEVAFIRLWATCFVGIGLWCDCVQNTKTFQFSCSSERYFSPIAMMTAATIATITVRLRWWWWFPLVWSQHKQSKHMLNNLRISCDLLLFDFPLDAIHTRAPSCQFDVDGLFAVAQYNTHSTSTNRTTLWCESNENSLFILKRHNNNNSSNSSRSSSKQTEKTHARSVCRRTKDSKEKYVHSPVGASMRWLS